MKGMIELLKIFFNECYSRNYILFHILDCKMDILLFYYFRCCGDSEVLQKRCLILSLTYRVDGQIALTRQGVLGKIKILLLADVCSFCARGGTLSQWFGHVPDKIKITRNYSE